MKRVLAFLCATVIGVTACRNAVEPISIPKASPPALNSPEPFRFSQKEMFSSFRSLIDETIQVAVPDALTLPEPVAGARFGELLPAGTPLNGIDYVAFGGSLTAGFRDMGLYRAGQLAAYPNLVARQMGLKDFQTPAFAPEEGNGTGFLRFTGTARRPVWALVDNNTASQKPYYFDFRKYQGRIDNYAVPYNLKSVFFSSYKLLASYGREPGTGSFTPFKDRLAPAGQEKLTNTPEQIADRLANVYTLEIGFDDYITLFLRPVSMYADSMPFADSPYAGFMRTMQEKNSRGVVLLMPTQVLDLPYFKFFNNNATNNMELSLLNNMRGLNNVMRDVAKLFNTPVVDLDAIYSRILKGEYVTNDGYRIDPAFPGGNFFSQDGIYPSAIGQAVIANEVIRVMNQAYKADIPLVNVGAYARQMK